jgi:DNA-binding Lrp family transcriptional regulator
VNWRATLLSLDFFIDAANLSRAGGDLLQPLVFAAIAQANQAVLRNDPELQARYGDTGEAIPDALRRPISVNAVAQSLRLPFETVRRKVRLLIASGLCVATASGVYVPREAIVSEAHAAIQTARMARLEQLRADLVRVGFLSPDEASSRPSAALRRSVNRALSEYMLRCCDRAIELTGGVSDGFVLLGLCLVCTDEMQAAPLDVAPALRPSSMRSIALRLGMPHETVRRRLLALERSGLARRRGRGWIPVAPRARRAAIARLAEDNELDLRRLFARLRELAQAPPAPS